MDNRKIDELIKEIDERIEKLEGKEPKQELTETISSNQGIDREKLNKLIKEIDERIEKLEGKESKQELTGTEETPGEGTYGIDEIKNILRRKATIFETGGIRPTNEMYESWIGKVGWQQENEELPMDKEGNPMIPLATIFLEKLEYVPESLKGIKLITIFMSSDIWNNISEFDYKDWFTIKTYDNLDNLVPCNYTSEDIIPFPLLPKLVTDEFPFREDLDYETFEMIEELEENEDIDYIDDIFEENYITHKIGGYPSIIQGGLEHDEGFEFVLQIASDEKADFNIVDSGNFYFCYNPTTKQWSITCDFY